VSDRPVDSCALTSRNSSVVNNRNGTPTTIILGADASLAVGIFHARIVNGLTFPGKQGDLVCNQFENLLGLPLTNSRIETLHEHENVSVPHRPIEIIWRRGPGSSERHSISHNFRSVDRSIDSLDNTLGTFINPNLALEVLDGSLGPDSSVWLINSCHLLGESSIPFTLDVTLINL